MFLSTVVLQLVGAGTVDLDSPVSRYLPGVLADGDKITVRMMLQHTSGLHDYTDDVPLDGKAYQRIRFQHQSAEAFVAEAAAKPRNFPAGTAWSYSNTNYLLAGMLIEAVTGHSWGDEVTQRVFRPLGHARFLGPW
ncbi:serine hydrolase domain-containing protein [Fodinicola feengrottensis]|uniref:serine hydrolase domain-containing protein n=1 Tax=Fodinicola feengrottensis TaxID=435914 RepID=UPI0013D516ED|nr:serine hydrolase domain-containing protein [Fodinicola feengrottensis]